MKTKIAFCLLFALVGCGGGGGGGGGPKNCPSDGYPLYCSTVSEQTGKSICCAPDRPYACGYLGQILCYKDGCPFNTAVLDYCEGE